MKEYLKKAPHFLWYFIALVFIVSVMDIKSIPPRETNYIFIEDIQKASEQNHKSDGYNIDYYSTKEQFIKALKNDMDVDSQRYDFIVEKIEDPAPNRRYAKLTLYYKVSTYYTIRHNIWLVIRTINDKPDSVFEVILSRMDLGNLFALHSIDGKASVENAMNGKLHTFADFTVYPNALQKISGVDNVYYSSLLSEEAKLINQQRYNSYYAWIHEIYFMEM